MAEQPTIDRQTKITVGATLSIVMALVACAGWVTSGQASLRAEIQDVRNDVAEVKLKLAEGYATRSELSTLSAGHAALQARVAALEAVTKDGGK